MWRTRFALLIVHKLAMDIFYCAKVALPYDVHVAHALDKATRLRVVSPLRVPSVAIANLTATTNGGVEHLQS